MVNRNTKYWFFTWEVNAVQRKLPAKEKVKTFLYRIADYAQFQEEVGNKKKNLHYQEYLELSGSRISKRKLLDTFKANFRNIGGLTVSKVSLCLIQLRVKNPQLKKMIISILHYFVVIFNI